MQRLKRFSKPFLDVNQTFNDQGIAYGRFIPNSVIIQSVLLVLNL